MIDAFKIAGNPQPMAKVMASQSVEQPVVEPISLQQAKDHLRVVFDDEDAYISALITAARQMAEGKLNRTIAARTIKATFDSWAAPLVLPKPPLIAVEEIGYVDSAGESTFLESGYIVTSNPEPARIWPQSGYSLPTLAAPAGAVTVRYRAGYEEGNVPQPIIMWMLLAIGSMYANREAVTAGVTPTSLPDNYMSWFLQPYMVYE